MLAPDRFTSFLTQRGLSFFTGVPDSLLKEFCAYITDTLSEDAHVITANEGGAVALAAGSFLATGSPGVVYLQNSGIGNTINPLLSLVDGDVYSIPMLLIVGWRGEPGVKDEPQHVKQGQVQENLISALGYRYEILSTDENEAEAQIGRLIDVMREKSEPVFLLVRKNTFTSWSNSSSGPPRYEMNREQVLEEILDWLGPEDRIVSTTGKTSREIYEIRDSNEEGHHKDFLTVGSMGHSSMIALGIALRSRRRIVCVDGDGAALMHLGSLAIVGTRGLDNFVHVMINNGAHESVGGQQTVGFDIAFTDVARGVGYKAVYPVVSTKSELLNALEQIDTRPGPHFLEVRVKKGARSDLGRPKSSPIENRNAFMENL